MPTFNKFLSGERRRLKKLVAAGQKKLVGMTRELANLKRHLAALDMFESTRKGRATGSRGRKRRGSSKRPRILAALKSSSNGMNSRRDPGEASRQGEQVRRAERHQRAFQPQEGWADQVQEWPLHDRVRSAFFTGSEAENCVVRPRRLSQDRIVVAQSQEFSLASDTSATRTGGSPCRRGPISTGTSLPEALATSPTTSFTL